jgi:hypothetical protein
VAELAAGKSIRLKATVYPRSASQDVLWQIVDGPARVDDRGKVTALGEGEITVRAVSRVNPDIESDECLINGVVKVSSFRVLPTNAVVLSDSEARFRVEILPFMATNMGIIMISDYPQITAETDGDDFLEVDDDGFITLNIGDIRGGPYTVTFICDGKRATVRLTIRDAPDEIEIMNDFAATDFMIQRGRTIQVVHRVLPLTADQSVIWFSSNESVARIDNKGNLRGIGPGTVEIWCITRATDEDGAPLAESEVIELECVVPVSSIRLTPSREVILTEDGESFELRVEVLPVGAFEADEWEYSITGRDGVINVDKNDDSLILSPEEPGNVTLNVVHPLTGRRASVKVTVRGNPEEVIIRGRTDPRELRRGTRLTLTAQVLPSSAVQRVYWESDDTSVIRISNTGAITVVGPGTANVWAWTYNVHGVEIESESIEITTVIPVTGISLTPNRRTVTIYEGDSVDYDCVTRPFPEAFRGVNTDWVVRSSRPSVADASISEVGGVATLIISGESPGQANITVRVGGKSVIVRVTVRAARD